jgi:hypothetical protein
MRERALVAQLASTECMCGDPKDPRRTFCRRCYYRLPPRMRSALYQNLSEGYEQAVDEAEAFLRGRMLQEKRRDGRL